MFLSFVIDMPDYVMEAVEFLFAEDTAMVVSAHSPAELQDKVCVKVG